MKKQILTILLSLLVIPNLIGPLVVLAASQTATPSASPTLKAATTSATPSQTEDIQEKIKALVKENLSATESNLKEKINQHTLVGYVGHIQNINSGNITLTTREESLLQVTTDGNTNYIKDGLAAKLSTLAISDKIIVIGTLLKEDIVLAKRIVVVKEDPNAMTSGVIFGTVSTVDIKKKIIGITNNSKEILYTLTKKSTIVISEIKVGDPIFAITKKFENKDYISRAKVI